LSSTIPENATGGSLSWDYDDAPDNELFLITGSCQTLEISLKNRNANERLHGAPGQRITIS